ncbi:hypothetical protein K435DRAFT_59739 [Dendrothele bispora CBS 962.96]|uniref:Uncharacterized protein n=1 Tax=Dendrothele bispora (strain CBS 962.96) TaxID=1314807 RepID=A0A4S8M5R7_DENBC|nr:hypothetical protein K435DRAFT_59739 [Dendrothele bispora CBS 962.96]
MAEGSPFKYTICTDIRIRGGHASDLNIACAASYIPITVQDVLYPIVYLLDPKICAQVFYDILQVDR